MLLWRGLAEVADKFVKKGSQLYIEGKIRTRSYDDKEGNKRYITEIVADNMQMLGKKGDTDNSANPRMHQATGSGTGNNIVKSTPVPETAQMMIL